MVKINGENCPQAIGSTITAWLVTAGYDERAVAVEYNEMILPKTAYASTVISEGDIIEIVCFMGGGC